MSTRPLFLWPDLVISVGTLITFGIRGLMAYLTRVRCRNVVELATASQTHVQYGSGTSISFPLQERRSSEDPGNPCASVGSNNRTREWGDQNPLKIRRLTAQVHARFAASCGGPTPRCLHQTKAQVMVRAFASYQREQIYYLRRHC